MSTIRTLKYCHPHLFHHQDWYEGEAFIDLEDTGAPEGLPTIWDGHPPGVVLPPAVRLVTLFVQHPEAECFRRFIWCADTDQVGQRVYVGGVQYGRIEIHRHLHLSEKWGYPVWP